MPLYYFDIVDVDGLHVDDTGVECDDIDAAIAMARRTISELAHDAFRDPGQSELAIRIRDDMEDPVVLRVTLETTLVEGQSKLN
jgi:hypothetical protein